MYKDIFFENNNLPIIIVDIDSGKIVDANKQALKFYCISKKQILDKKIFDFSALSNKQVNSYLQNSFLQKINKWNTIHKTCNNEYFKLSLVSNKIDKNGKKLVFLTITDCKKIVEEISFEDIEQKHDLLKEAEAVAFFVINYNYDFEYFDNDFKNIFELEQYNLNFDNWLNCFSLEKIELIKNYFSSADKKPFVKQLKIKTRNQNTKEIFLKLNFLKNKAIGVSIEITNRIELLEELRENQLFNKKIIEQTSNIIYVFDVQKNKNIFINKDLRKVLGYKKDELYEDSLKTIMEIIHPDDLKQFEKYQQETKNWEKEYVHTFQMRLKANDGSWRWFFGKEKEFLRKNGKVQKTIGVLTEFTEIYNYEKKLLEQNNQYQSLNEEYRIQNEQLKIAKEKAEENNELKNEFLHNLSHEIRTPMNGIIGFAELLNENPAPEKQKFYSQVIFNSGKQLLRIIDDILEISRLETKQVDLKENKINLNSFLDEIFGIFDFRAKQSGIPLYLTKKMSDAESNIIIDDAKLHKIISNLIDNALKYTNSGYIEVGNYLQDNKIIIYVKDTGVGIPEEMKTAIFDRFRRAEDNLNKKNDGIGLGLSIAKENTQLLKGEITLKSKLDEGTTFKITLPYNKFYDKNEQEDFIENNFNNQTDQEPAKILIAEDEEINFVYIDLLIKNEFKNINIIHAKNGKEAIDIFKTEKNIKLIFMDIKMPLVNGFEATSEIKKINKNIPVIALTAYTTEEDKQEAEKVGVDEFLSKPAEKSTIFSLIRKAIKEN